MSLETFEYKDLKKGDEIEITYKDGSIITGMYMDDFDAETGTFQLRNSSKPEMKTVSIQSISVLR
jgi:hypothetical protein